MLTEPVIKPIIQEVNYGNIRIRLNEIMKEKNFEVWKKIYQHIN